MASAIVKTLKFVRILNGRLSFSTVKHINGHNFIRYYANQTPRRTYATAVHNIELNEDSSEKNTVDLSKALRNDTQSIESRIEKLDYKIRRTGRTQMKSIQEIFSLITSKDVTSDVHALYLIRSCKHCRDEPPAKRIQLVNKIWNRYQELGVEFGVQHYNALLDAHTTNGLNFDPAQILVSMEEHNIEPNKTTYMLVMKKYCQDGNIGGASEILEHMKGKQMSIDEKVFNYLIEGHIKNNDIEGAKEMVDVMRSSKLEPNTDTHAILACGYAAVGNKDQMMAHLNECGNTDNAASCLKVIVALASSGNKQYIDDVFALIKDTRQYTQEIVNCFVELIHKNHIDVAYKLVTELHNAGSVEGINIFVKQLMRTERPPSEIVDYCECISKEGYNKEIFGLAIKVSAENQQLDYTFALFKKMEEHGQFIKPARLWSVIREQKSPKGIYLVLEKMSEIGIPCDFTTYLEVVYPALGVPQPTTVLRKIENSNQSLEAAADALFVYYCSIGEIEHAERLIEEYPVKVSNRLDVRGLVNLNTNLNSRLFPKYLKVLKYALSDRHNFTTRFDVQGRLLADLLSVKPRLVESLLHTYEDLKFSEHTLNICEGIIREKNPTRLSYLRRLKEVISERGNMFEGDDISTADEDKYIKKLQAQNVTCRPFLIKRLHHHIREKNVDRVQELLSLYDELKLEYIPLLVSNLIEMWCAAGDLEKAKSAFDKLRSEFPEFKLDISKAVDYSALLIKYEKFEESYETLQHSMKDYITSSKSNLLRSIKRFTAVLTETQDIEFIRKMQNLVEQLSKETNFKNNFVDSVIRLHLNRNDTEAAFEEFKNVIRTHGVPAGLRDLYRKCVNTGETEILQKVIDITTSCSGKSFALVNLALVFIETFNPQKAVTVFEKLGRETDPHVLEDTFAKLSDRGRLTELVQLLSVTRSLSHVNRGKLYGFVLKACVNRNECEKALALVDSMKNEGLEPDVQYVTQLRELLEKNNQTVPLSVISNSEAEIISSATEATKAFSEHLQAGNAADALKELDQLKKGYIRTLPIQTLTDLVELCLQEDCTSVLSTNVHAMSYIIENVKDVLKPILEKYSKAGDIEILKAIPRFIPDFSLMSLNFNNYFCNAFISCGKYEELLSQLEELHDKKTKLFSTSAFGELLKRPECEDRAVNLAVKHYESNYNLPIAVVWAHYFSKEQFERADELLKNFSVPVEKVDMFILRRIKENENVSVAKKYVEFIKTVNVRMRLKERVFGTAIDLLVLKGMYDDAVDLVLEAEKLDLQLHKYYTSTLVTLKSNLEKENKPVPFILPELSTGPSSDFN